MLGIAKKSSLTSSSNSLGVFSMYVLAEFILVVVGILVAVSINNWNESRKDELQEQDYLIDLLAEYGSNLARLNNLVELTENQRSNALQIANLYAEAYQRGELIEDDFNLSLARVLFQEVQFRPQTGVIADIINSGKLEIFTTEIRSKIASWDGELTRIRFQEQEHARYRIRLMELLEDNGNIFSFISSTVSNLEINQSQFQTSNTELLENEQFENLLVGFYLTSRFMTASYLRPLIGEMENTMNLIDARIEALANAQAN